MSSQAVRGEEFVVLFLWFQLPQFDPRNKEFLSFIQ